MTTLYSRLAFVGIKKNGRAYAPYILTSSLMVMIFYIIGFLAGSPLLHDMRGGSGMTQILTMGIIVMAIFSAIFLFYTNSFLIKRRKREFGLYNILGLGKVQIARILIWETLLVYAISIIAGLGFGMLFSKLAEFLATRMLSEQLVYSFSVDIPTIIGAIIWFAIVFTAILLNSLRQLFFSRPIELFRSENTGERPPRTNIPGAVIGLTLLGIAYYMAVTIERPDAALVAFTFAVILVIIATYLLFIAGSVVMCRILQKNKKYYYQTNHFVSVSQMAYRMRRNGAGLASICILATMVLVTISSTSSLFIGINGYVEREYPYDIMTTAYVHNDISDFDKMYEAIGQAVKDSGFPNAPHDEYIQHRLGLNTTMLRNHMGVPLPDPDLDTEESNYYVSGYFYLIEEFDEVKELGITLGERDIAVYEPLTDHVKHMDTITIGDVGEFNIIPIEQQLKFDEEELYSTIEIPVYIFVKDISVLDEIFQYQKDDIGRSLYITYNFNISDSESDLLEVRYVCDKLRKYDVTGEIEQEYDIPIEIDTRATLRDNYYGIYSGLFFLGILMGGVFILAAALIMYYKQISEGFEDAARFEILQKVGMSRREVKSAINSQVLTVFFLPLAAAGLHMAFAFPILSRLLRLFNMTDTGLFGLMTVASFAVFTLMYVLFYKLTSRSYLGIVSGNNK
ncbi:MAG: ABC transporter permease [Ruminococcaceae bacterium]|nr:ABC transporter permease [Oscillospiraceae bacterium]